MIEFKERNARKLIKQIRKSKKKKCSSLYRIQRIRVNSRVTRQGEKKNKRRIKRFKKNMAS